MVRLSKKRPKMDAKMHSKKTSKKNDPEIDLGFRYGLPKPTKIPPKTSKIAPPSDVERSLFRDAMQLTASRRKLTGGIAFRPPIWLRI